MFNQQILGIKCLSCGEIIVSKHRHDFKWCKCGSSFVDGGRDYLRYGGESEKQKVVEINDYQM